jgi:hypothetical protein
MHESALVLISYAARNPPRPLSLGKLSDETGIAKPTIGHLIGDCNGEWRGILDATAYCHSYRVHVRAVPWGKRSKRWVIEAFRDEAVRIEDLERIYA